MSTTPVPPRASRRRRSMLLAYIAAGLCAIALVRHARADEIPANAMRLGWRIQVSVCTDAGCKAMPMSRRIWPLLHACQGRAENIEIFADVDTVRRIGLPAGTKIHARCLRVMGDLAI